MTEAEQLANELKKHSCICYYPSCGSDLSNIDFFASGKKPLAERTGEVESPAGDSAEICAATDDPDLFIHTDVNFYQEFAAGLELAADECGIHGSFEIIEFNELPQLEKPNQISPNYDFSGKCFVYKLRLWGSDKIRTLIFCLCENEFFVARIFLAHQIKVSYIWSRNWNGGQTYGTWLANVLAPLNTLKLYSDWLCLPGQRGAPPNRLVAQKYPELMTETKVKLERNNDLHWIDEGGHGWVEEFDVVT